MPEDEARELRERVIKLEGRQEGHETICTIRYGEIAKTATESDRKLTELNAKVTSEFAAQNIKIDSIVTKGLILAIILIGIELGKITIPGLFEAISKVIH